MTWRTFKSSLLLCGGGLLSACGTAPAVAPKGQTVCVASADRERTRITVPLQNELLIQLPALTTPGTAWTLVANDARYLQPLRPLRLDAEGHASAAFLAVQEGRRPIRFFALPPQDRAASPTQICEVLVTIE